MASVQTQGIALPRLGLGTFRMQGAACEAAVVSALALGCALGWNTSPDGSFTHNRSNLLGYAIASFNPRSGVAAAAAANDGRASVWNAVGDAVRQASSAV